MTDKLKFVVVKAIQVALKNAKAKSVNKEIVAAERIGWTIVITDEDKKGADALGIRLFLMRTTLKPSDGPSYALKDDNDEDKLFHFNEKGDWSFSKIYVLEDILDVMSRANIHSIAKSGKEKNNGV
jgi:hypothetical protein